MAKITNTKTVNAETIARIEERRARFHSNEERSLKATQNIIASMQKAAIRKQLQEEKRQHLKAGLAFYHENRGDIVYVEEYIGGQHISFAFLAFLKNKGFYDVSYAIKSKRDEHSNRVVKTILGTRLLDRNCINLYLGNEVPEQNKKEYLFHFVLSHLIQKTITRSLHDQILRRLVKKHITNNY